MRRVNDQNILVGSIRMQQVRVAANAASAASTSDRSTARSTSSDLCGNQIYGAFA